MSFLGHLFSKRPPPFKYPSIPEFIGAGCLFRDANHVLAGYQPTKKKPGITGIGGHREGAETYLITAFRETIEELFHVETIPRGLIDILQQQLIPQKVLHESGYISIVFTFQDLDTLLKICKRKGLRSELYPAGIPLTWHELILEREKNVDAEVASLTLLPILDNPKAAIIRSDLLSDMKGL